MSLPAVQTAAIYGGTASGVEIALALLRAGIAAQIVEPDPDAAERAAFFLRKAPPPLPPVGARLTGPVQLAVLADAIPVPAELGPETAIATVAADIPDDARCVRWRGFALPGLAPLAEISPGPATAGWAADRAAAALTAAGRVVVRLAPGQASVAWHLLDRLHDTADALLLDGAVPWEVDEAMVAAGFTIGVYEAQDLAGLDRAHARRQARPHDPRRRHVPISDRMVAEGRLGKAIGVGWYRYPGGGGAVIDPLLEDLITEEAWFAQVERRMFSPHDIHDRLMLALVNAAGTLRRTGVAPATLDRVATHVLGFPAAPGLWQTACDAARGDLVARLRALQAEDDVAWAPDPYWASG
ncbi:MAG: 3-hydroxyacyl-CoA dehydrogenase family protein [Rhodobacteraceae bacterium]|nr:3-hydroxyacyl-CoA dehydrogenase family protein [Paracoccaceae bacterium]